MKWIGQHIWDFVSRFRNDVYFENLETTNETLGLVVDADGKVSINPNSGDETAEKVHYYVKAAEDLVAGNAVYASGAVGNSEAIEVSKYIANNTIDERRFLGIMQQDLLQGEFGYVITLGTLKPVDATGSGFDASIGETWLEGDILFASPTYAGELTKVQPHAPNQVIPCAFVLKNNSNGTLAIRAYDLGYHLNEIHDVEITTPTEGEVLRYDSNSDIWENTDSLVIDSTGKVGIGTTSPSTILHVNGAGGSGVKTQIKVTQEDDGAGHPGSDAILESSGWGEAHLRLQNHDIAAAGGGLAIRSSTKTDFMVAGNFGTSVMHISSSGNVGIGTTSPSYKLTSYDTSNDTFPIVAGAGLNVSSFTGIGLSGFVASNGAVKAAMVLQRVGNYGTGDIHFLNNDTENNSDATLADAKMTIKENGNVGIGTTSPVYKLDVNGDVNIPFGTSNGYRINGNRILSQGSGFFEFGVLDYKSIYPNISTNNDGTFRIQSNGSTLVTVNQSGNVGIGTISPDTELHVESGDTILTLEGSNSSYVNAATQLVSNHATNARGMGTFAYDASTDVEWFWGNPYSYNDAFVINRNTGYTVPSSQNSPPGIGASAGTLFKIASSGNVGIGTTSPNAKLDVAGSIRSSLGGSWASSAGGVQITYDGVDTGTMSMYYDAQDLVLGAGVTNKNGITISGTGADNKISMKAGGSDRVTVLGSSGNVGIGTASPQAKLHLNSGSDNGILLENGNAILGNTGSGYTELLYWSNGNAYYGRQTNSVPGGVGGSVDSHSFRTGGQTRLIIDSSGDVGIGTTSPAYALDIEKDTTSILNLYRPNSSTAAASVLDFSFNTANATESVYARIRADVETNTDLAQGGDLSFHTANNGTVSEKLRITQEGNVGIGTTSPVVGLQVESSTSETSRSLRLAYDSSYFFDLKQKGAGGISYNAQNSSAGGHRFEIDGSEKVRIAYSGNVGIGTSSPLYPFSVESDTTGLISRIYNTNTDGQGLLIRAGSTSSPTRVLQVASSNDTKIMTVNSNGNVGIGTSSPSYNLDVQGSTNGIIRAYGGTIGRLSLQNSTRHYSTSVQGSNWLFYDETGGAERLRITSAGNVGIGTTSPLGKLHVENSAVRSSVNSGADNIVIEENGYSGITILSSSANAGQIHFGDQDAENVGMIQYFHSDNSMRFATGNAGEKLRIDSSGNVGIGTTTPNAKLEVAGNIAFSNKADSLIFGSTGADGTWAAPKITRIGTKIIVSDYSGVQLGGYDGSAYGARMTVLGTGNVGIGTASPTSTLHVNGNTQIDGTLRAISKSFDIPHPTQEGRRLVYGSLEGPEHAVYARGESKSDMIHLPEEWVGLVEESTISVQLTAIGSPDCYFYKGYESNVIMVGGPSKKHYFYFVQATRKDVEPLITVQ